ncbi:hypothetical protein L6452_21211 [Arctium lappa]|uniref:Uncharacterized protein n=1 Tax=Arctium lappa TaxID=4217 RepID=A0ACB9BET7_ARCLA|nr:hypothetical protein L6452_21211 [Arctium lappa]
MVVLLPIQTMVFVFIIVILLKRGDLKKYFIFLKFQKAKTNSTVQKHSPIFHLSSFIFHLSSFFPVPTQKWKSLHTPNFDASGFTIIIFFVFRFTSASRD